MTEGGQHLTRRRFLGGLIVLGLAVVPSGLGTLFRATPHDESRLAVERLTGRFRDPTEMRALGRAHLGGCEDCPGERELLAELLSPDMDHATVVASSDDEFRDALRTWTSDDLVSGRVEEVDGWLLGQAEIRLAALVGMVSMPGGWALRADTEG